MQNHYLKNLTAVIEIQQGLSENLAAALPGIQRIAAIQIEALQAAVSATSHVNLQALASISQIISSEELLNLLDNIARINAPLSDLPKRASQILQTTDFSTIARFAEMYQSQLRGIVEVHQGMSIVNESLLKDLRRTIDNLQLEFADDLKALPDDEYKELQQAIVEVFSDDDNWQQRLIQALDEWKERNPLYYKVFRMVAYIVVTLGISLAPMQMTGCVGLLREEPGITAEKVLYLESDMKFTIINEAPYYFEIEILTNNDTSTIIGWISKRQISSDVQIVVPEGKDSTFEGGDTE